MRRALLLSLVLALPAVPARADPIIFITGGSLDLTGGVIGSGPLEIQGTRNFSLNAIAEATGNFGFACFPCAPGTRLNLGGGFSELGGTAMLKGQSFTFPSIEADAFFRFAASALVPPLAAHAVLSVPFELVQGEFTLLDLPQNGFNLTFPLVGRGTATVHLGRESFIDAWSIERSHYEFANAAPVPEPTSIVLLGSGLFGLLGLRRRRN